VGRSLTAAAPIRGLGVLDTSVLLADDVPPIPGDLAISTASIAELHFGILLTDDPAERSTRLQRMGELESFFEPLPIDAAVAREYGRLASATAYVGRQPRSRVMDLLIAATAVAHGAALYTRNPDDLKGLERLVDVVAV
jgi:predicted nucleic acid-binding protein